MTTSAVWQLAQPRDRHQVQAASIRSGNTILIDSWSVPAMQGFDQPLKVNTAEFEPQGGGLAADRLAWSQNVTSVALLVSSFESVPVLWAWVESASLTLGWAGVAVEAARVCLYEQGVIRLTDQGGYSLDADVRRLLQDQRDPMPPAHPMSQAVGGAIAQAAQQLVRLPSALPMPEAAQILVPHLVPAIASGAAALSRAHRQWCCVALGNIAQAQQCLSQAELWYRHGLAGSARRDSQAAQLHNLTHLARLYHHQGNFRAAHRLFAQAILTRRSRGRDRPTDLAISFSHLADLYKTEGRYAEAERAYRQALNLRTMGRDRPHPDCALSLNDLAGLYFAQGQYDRAELLYREALRWNRAWRGHTDATVALGLHHLAAVFYARQHYQSALATAIEAAAIGSQLWGAEHPQTVAYQDTVHIIQRAIGATDLGTPAQATGMSL